jgi:polysaccharide pyruvyl transferase WcaK-like protein
MGKTTLRVATYGYFGMGNVGNEGSLAAFLAYLRDAHPDAAVHCFAADADEVRREHGVGATRLMAYRPAPGSSGFRVRATKAASRLWDVPRTFRMMRDVDVLVVPGTGVLETQLVAQPWGLPYWLFLAALSCRLRGRRVALVSVGAEHPAHPLTRWLHRSTVRLAHYRSYRDDGSREAVRAMGVTRSDGVFPDLAFSLPVPTAEVRPGHVVIGVMAYQGAPDDPGRGPDVLRAYVAHMTQLVTRLLDGGGTVSLVIGDVADFALAEEIEERARAARPGLDPGRLAVSRAGSLTELMAEMAAAEVVVASRFHNVICALKARRPTVSLGYAGKNARLLSEFGLPGFDQPMDSFDVERLVQQVAEVRRRASGTAMEDTLRRYQAELEQQFRRLSADLLGTVPATRREPASST